MAYTAHTWSTGDTITAELLNALEQALATLSADLETAQAAIAALSANDGANDGE